MGVFGAAESFDFGVAPGRQGIAQPETAAKVAPGYKILPGIGTLETDGRSGAAKHLRFPKVR